MSKWQQITLFFGLGILIAFNVFRWSQKDWDYADPIDLRGLYLGAELWESGHDLYSDKAGAELWNEHKEVEGFESKTDFGDQWVSIMVYPPHAFVISRPLIAFSWKTARIIWWIICIILLFVSSYLLYEISGNVLSIYLILAFKGTFFALALGQPVLLVFCCLLLAMHFKDRRAYLAGIFLGIAMIKFNLVVPFGIWFLLQRRWSLLLTGALTTAAMLLIVVWDQPELIAQYSAKLSAYYEMIYQRDPENIYTYSDSELSMFLSNFIGRDIGFWKNFNAIGQLISYSLIAWFSLKNKWHRSWTLLGLILSSFLFTYHLSYDGLILLIPILMIPLKKSRWIAIFLFMVFSLPWNSVFHSSELIKLNYPLFITLGLLLFTFAKGKSTIEESSIHTST